jgi:hypothetical protein
MRTYLVPVGCGHLHTVQQWPSLNHADETPQPPAPVRWFSDDYIGFQPYSRPYSQPYTTPYSRPYP